MCVDTGCYDKLKKGTKSGFPNYSEFYVSHVYFLINIWGLVSHQIYKIWFLERASAKYLNGSITISILMVGFGLSMHAIFNTFRNDS